MSYFHQENNTSVRRNLNTLLKKCDIEGVFSHIFTMLVIHRVTCTTLSFVSNTPHTQKLYDPRQKNIATSLVSPMLVLISWGMEDDDGDGVWINADSGGGGGADPPAQQPPPCSPRGRPAGKGRQLWRPPHPPPQGHGQRLAPHGPAADTPVTLPRCAPGGNKGEGCVGAHPTQVGVCLRLNAP